MLCILFFNPVTYIMENRNGIKWRKSTRKCAFPHKSGLRHTEYTFVGKGHLQSKIKSHSHSFGFVSSHPQIGQKLLIFFHNTYLAQTWKPCEPKRKSFWTAAFNQLIFDLSMSFYAMHHCRRTFLCYLSMISGVFHDIWFRFVDTWWSA